MQMALKVFAPGHRPETFPKGMQHDFFDGFRLDCVTVLENSAIFVLFQTILVPVTSPPYFVDVVLRVSILVNEVYGRLNLLALLSAPVMSPQIRLKWTVSHPRRNHHFYRSVLVHLSIHKPIIDDSFRSPSTFHETFFFVFKKPPEIMGGGISQSVIDNQLNSMVANVFVSIASYCSTNDVSSQTLTINCDPGPYTTSIYEENPACSTCLDNIVNNQTTYYALQQATWARQGAAVRGSIDLDFQNVIQQFVACGLASCKACVVDNVSQNTVIQSVLTCDSFSNVQNSIAQQLSSSVNQTLTNNQDILAQLGEMLGAKSTSEVVQNVTNRILANITETLVAQVQQTISTNQNLTFTIGNSEINGVSQSSAYTSIMNFFEQNQVFNNVFSQAEIQQIETAVNSQDTIGEIGGAIVGVVQYLSHTLTSIVGQVVIGCFIVLGVIVAGIVLFITTRLVQKEIKKRQEQKQAAKHVS